MLGCRVGVLKGPQPRSSRDGILVSPLAMVMWWICCSVTVSTLSGFLRCSQRAMVVILKVSVSLPALRVVIK